MIFINQAKYTREFIKKFWLEDAKLARLLWLPQLSLTRMNKKKMLTLNSTVAWLVACFTWRLVGRILCFVFACVRFQSFPKKSHLIAVKRIIRYLKGTIGMSLWCSKTGQFLMTSYSDADYACCRVDRKSTSRTCQLLGNCLVSWSSKNKIS